ncbi:MAG: hypothetical protein HKN47_12885, partial [Pirellulaceae bacterium]|nr:hypothetical protein [Pirellulaceae bacterium]
AGPLADGDDAGSGTTTVGVCSVAGDDEDGVSFDDMLVACNNSNLTVTATQAGVLDAWIDFNGDGDWLDAGEKITSGRAVQAGANAVAFTVPTNAVPGETVARFRLSPNGLSLPTGPVNGGEVEDYVVTIRNGQSAGPVSVELVESASTLLAVGGNTVIRGNSSDLLNVPHGSVERLEIHGNLGNNLITLDQSGGNVIPPGGLSVHGGGGENWLNVRGADGPLNLAADGNVTARNLHGIDLRDVSVNQLHVDAQAITTLSTNGTVQVLGGEKDAIVFRDQAQWRIGATSVVDGRFVRQVRNVIGGQVFDTEFPHAWQNLVNPADIDNNGTVNPGDIISVIIELTRLHGLGQSQGLPDPLTVDVWPGLYFDPNGNNEVTPSDLLFVINAAAEVAQSRFILSGETNDGAASDVIGGSTSGDTSTLASEGVDEALSQPLSSSGEKVASFDSQSAASNLAAGNGSDADEAGDSAEAADRALANWELDSAI